MKASRFLFLEIGLLVSSVLAPVFFGSVYPWAFLSFAAVFFLLLFVYPEAVSEIKDLPLIFRGGMSIVFCLVLFQWVVTSQNRYETGSELLKWLAFGSAFLLVQRLPQSTLLRLMMVFVFLGFFESLYGLWQVRTGREMVLWQKKEAYLGFVTGTFLNRNHLAGLLELCLGVQAAFILSSLRERKIKRVILFALLFLISLVGFISTGSRMGGASFLISLFLFGFFLFPQRKSGFVFISAIALLAGLAFWAARDRMIVRFTDYDDWIQSWSGRYQVWKDTVKMLRDFPGGIGLGSFEWVFPGYQSEKSFMGWMHAHNDYLELLAELGVAGFIALAASFLGLLSRLFKGLASRDESTFPFVWGILVSVTSLLLHSLADFNLAIPANALVFLLLLALGLRFVNVRT